MHRYELSSVLIRFLPQPFQKAGANSCSAFKNTSKDGSQAEAAVPGFFRL